MILYLRPFLGIHQLVLINLLDLCLQLILLRPVRLIQLTTIRRLVLRLVLIFVPNLIAPLQLPLLLLPSVFSMVLADLERPFQTAITLTFCNQAAEMMPYIRWRIMYAQEFSEKLEAVTLEEVIVLLCRASQ